MSSRSPPGPGRLSSRAGSSCLRPHASGSAERAARTPPGSWTSAPSYGPSGARTMPEVLLADLMATHRGVERVCEAWAQNAGERGDWAETARRWVAVVERFPGTPMHVVRLGLRVEGDRPY